MPISPLTRSPQQIHNCCLTRTDEKPVQFDSRLWEPSQTTVPKRLERSVIYFQAPAQSESTSQLWRIGELYLAQKEVVGAQLWKPLNQIADWEGFSMRWDPTKSHWPRDLRILRDGYGSSKTSLIPVQGIMDSTKLLDRLKKVMANSLQCAPVLLSCKHHNLKSKVMHRLDAGRNQIVMSRCYFEGGNVLKAELNEQPVYLVGAANLWASVLIFHEIIHGHEIDSIPWRNELVEAVLDFQDGCNASDLSRDKQQQMLDFLFKAQEIPSSEGSKENLDRLSEFLALFQVAKKFMEEDFGVPCVFAGYEEGLNCIQLNFHLDFYMTCLPGGVVLLQDHQKCIEVLKKLVRNQTLMWKERELFKLMEVSARGLIDSCKEPLNQLELQLKKKGFHVLRVPGHFQLSPTQTILNFMNSVVFVSGNDSRTCIILPKYGATGEIRLRQAFVECLEEAQVGRTWILGPETAGENIFSESLAYDGSLRCQTIERYSSS